MKWKQRQPLLKYRESDSVLTKLASIRGIEDIDSFFNPQRHHLHDPYLFTQIEEAANRIIKAIMTGERIAVSSDVDADGVTSAAIMMRYLKHFTDNVYVIYHQRSHGHGIENQLDKIDDKTSLVIVLDSSTNSIGACKELKEKGIDVVILDHHNGKPNPYAILVNPMLDDYPNKNISGSVVTYKCLQVMDDTLLSDKVNADDFIDLVAVGLYADAMPVDVLENRYIIQEGLKNIRNPGLQAILSYKKVNMSNINSATIGFTIAPLLNGTARLDQIELCLRLLMSDDFRECVDIVKEMEEMKNKRQKMEEMLLRKYEQHVDPRSKIIIVTDPQASKNFNGLIATRMARKYQRPVIIMREGDYQYSGSYRTYGNFNMLSFLKQYNHLLDDIGGHEGAGGITIQKRNLNKLKWLIEEDLSDVTFESVMEYDLAIDASEITQEFIEQVEKFDYITGRGFEKAQFLVKNITIRDMDFIGNGSTIKIKSDNIECLKFKADPNWGSDLYDAVFGEEVVIDVVGGVNLNRWGRYVTKQVFMDDYRLKVV